MAADSSLVFNIVGKDKASNVVESVGRRVRAASILAAAGQLALGAGFASAAAHAISLASAVSPVLSLLGSLPAIGLAGAAAITVLGFGFANMGAALKSVGGGGGGGGATKILGDVAGAERRVTQAQREAKSAQEDLTRARKEAAERIAGYGRDIRAAQLDEESATNNLADAKKRLQEAAMQVGPEAADNYRDAELAVREAELALEDATKRTKDLKEEQKQANAEGVEGSEEVKRAKERQLEANEQLKAAEEDLAKARKGTSAGGGGGGGANPQAEALAKLAPNARAVVLELLRLKPAWENVQRAVQQRLWQGVAGDIRRLSDAYLPVARRRLVELAGEFNTAGRNAARLVTEGKFVRDVDEILGNTNRTVGILGKAVNPIISAFRTWALIGSRSLPEMAGWVATLAQRFDRWSTAAADSGRMAGWFRAGTDALKSLGIIAGNVVGIVAAVLRGGGADAGKGLLATLTEGSTRMRAFLNSAQGQQKINTVFSNLRSILSALVGIVPIVASGFSNFASSASAADGAGGSLADTLDVTKTVMSFLADHTDALGKALPWLAAGFLAYKASQVAANVAAAASIPIKIAEIASNWNLAAALRANTAALATSTTAQGANTVATGAGTAAENVSLLTRIRGTAALVASKVAMVAVNVATKAYTAAQWLLNVALNANPLGLIVIAIVAVAGGLYLLWTRSETFRRVVTAAFNAVWGAVKAGWNWVKTNFPRFYHMITDAIGRGLTWVRGRWDSFVGFVQKLPGRVAGSLSNMWNGLKSGFKAAINWVIGKWNNFSIGLPGFSFAGYSVPGITINTPNIPYLAVGGTAKSAGYAHVGERGPETVWLPQGATVEPYRGSPRGGGGQTVRVVFDIRGGDREMRRLIRSWIRNDNLLNE